MGSSQLVEWNNISVKNNKGWLADIKNDMSNEPIKFYYQLCTFPGYDGFHIVRKFTIKNPGKFINIQTNKYSSKKYELLKKSLPQRAYREYSVYDLEDIPYPTSGQWLAVKD